MKPLLLFFLAVSLFAQSRVIVNPFPPGSGLEYIPTPTSGPGSGTMTSATITAGTGIGVSGTCTTTTILNCTIIGTPGVLPAAVTFNTGAGTCSLTQGSGSCTAASTGYTINGVSTFPGVTITDNYGSSVGRILSGVETSTGLQWGSGGSSSGIGAICQTSTCGGSNNVVIIPFTAAATGTLVDTLPGMGATGAAGAAGATGATGAQGAAAFSTPGTSHTFSTTSDIFVCTSTCTITVPVPAAGLQYCAMNDDNVSTVITLSAIGSSARYENTARTAYGTAGTGTFISGGAAGDMVCILGRDTTHYLTPSFKGTWTAN